MRAILTRRGPGGQRDDPMRTSSRRSRPRRALRAALTLLASIVALPAAAIEAPEPRSPAAHRERALFAAEVALPYVDCACDGYGPGTSLGLGARAAFAHRALAWLELSLAPAWTWGTGALAVDRSTPHDRFLSLGAAAAWIVAPGRALEGRVGLGAGPYVQWGAPGAYRWTHTGVLARVFLGGALAVAPRWRVVQDLALEVGDGSLRASGGYPAGYLDGASSFLARATIDVGVEWAF